MDTNLQLTINSFRQLFPDKIVSLTFPQLLVKSLTAVKLPDISSFSRQVVTLSFTYWTSFMIMGLDQTYHAHQFVFSLTF